ncbi:MAG: response regulator [Caldilineaceae bacterium]|nr:response regulator [Caldilineaceae bacterium]
MIWALVALLTAYSVLQFFYERRRSDAAIQASARRHRALLETIPDIVLRRKQNGIYTDFKPAKHFGRFMPSADFIGKHVSEILPPDIAELSMATSAKALATGAEQIYEYRMPHRQTGLIRDYEARVLPSGDDEVQVIIRDVTGDKLQEERLYQTQKLESLGVLAGGIAHDFNNLLTGMLGQISLAKFKLEGGLPATKHLDRAIVSAERAADLTRQLLAYAGKGQFQIIQLDLSQLIRETTALIETALPNRAELQLDLADELAWIEADRGQIQQVVMNLVINAAEALQEGGGYVRISTLSQLLTTAEISGYLGHPLTPGAYVMLQVSDNGCGMDEKTLSRIFDPFFSTKKSGHGLGLAATLGIMRTHRGDLQVQSQLGVGTTFTLLFPAVAAQVVAICTNESAAKPEPATKPLVLVIDDEAAVRELVSDTLTTAGFQVQTAASGPEGIAYFRQQPQVGLILLDLKMPGMSGEETLLALRQLDPWVKVILSSGYHETEVSHHFQDREIVAFLQKPYNFAVLLQQVRNALLSDSMMTVSPHITA